MKGYRKRAVVYPVLAKRQSRSGLMEQTLREDCDDGSTAKSVADIQEQGFDIHGWLTSTHDSGREGLRERDAVARGGSWRRG